MDGAGVVTPGAGAGVVTAGAGAAGAWAAGAAGVVAGGVAVFVAGAAGAFAAGIAAEPVTGAVMFDSTLVPPVVRCVASADRPSVAAKKIAAATAVDFDMKFDEPVAPNRLPEAPEPKAAPMSAPLPCCSSTRAMIASADRTCTTTTRLNKVFMLFQFSILLVKSTAW